MALEPAPSELCDETATALVCTNRLARSLEKLSTRSWTALDESRRERASTAIRGDPFPSTCIAGRLTGVFSCVSSETRRKENDLDGRVLVTRARCRSFVA